MCDALLPHCRPRPILPVAKRVRFGDDIPPQAPLANPAWDPGSLVRMPQNTPPSVPSTPTPFCCIITGMSIVPLEPFYTTVFTQPGFTQAPIQDADAQANDQMHSAPGLVCSDRPEGCLPSRFDPSATQTVSTVCVRRTGMAVQGPPLRALTVSPCVHEGRKRRPIGPPGPGFPNSLDSRQHLPGAFL